MTGMSDREKAYEDKFAYSEELMFKARARASKLLGLWAAEKAGLPEDAYPTELINLITGGKDEKEIVGKVHADAKNKGVELSMELIHEKFVQCLAEAKQQIAAS